MVSASDWDFTSVGIVGSGAVGLYYGGRLAKAGEDVRFLVRSDYCALKENGLNVKSVHGDFALAEPSVHRSSTEIGPVDLVIVAWKATSNSFLAEVLKPLLHSRTQVLTLQNGLGNCETIAQITGVEQVMGALCFVCINRISPGNIDHSAGGKLTVGEWWPSGSSRLATIESRFRAANIHAQAIDNLAKSQWEKLIWNIPFNGFSVAEGGVTTDVLLADPRIVSEIRSVMSEVVGAAKSIGLPLSDDLIEYNIKRTLPMGPYRTSSMIDFVEGREVEVGPIWEEPVRRAAEAGCPMPHTRRLLDGIRNRLSERDFG